MNFEPDESASENSNVVSIARFKATQGHDSVVEVRDPLQPGPIEQSMRATLSKLVGSQYPDEFDWSVYDRIADKFDSPPRGGVVFNTTFKLANHHTSCNKCHYSFEIDSYGRGCFHNCEYCYAKDQLTTHGFWNKPQPFPVNLADVRKVFYDVFETDRASKWRSILERKVPLRVGSMSDSFMWMDTKYGVTKELLRIFRFYRYPHIIFTRSDLVAHDDYLSLLDKKLCAVQFSIIGNNDKLIRKIEPGAPSYRRRLSALRKLADAGIWTGVRINPLFPKYPDGFFSDRGELETRFGPGLESMPVLPFYDDNFIGEIAEAKVPSVLAGFVRLSSHTINSMSKILEVDLRGFFKPELLQAKGDKRYSDPEIAAYYKSFQQLCAKSKIRFSTCYIGNGLKDYFQYQDMWANKKDCCDVVGNVPSFKSSSQEIPWSVRHKHAKHPDVALQSEKAEIEADIQFKKMDSSRELPNSMSTD